VALEKDGEDTLRWNDNVRNEDMLHRAKEERSILETMKKRLTRWSHTTMEHGG